MPRTQRHRARLSGDDGATNDEADGRTLYPFRVNSWPASDPLVTSVGGTQLSLDNAGNRLSPDVVWNDGFGASGGGVSAIFSRPLYQIGVTKVVGEARYPGHLDVRRRQWRRLGLHVLRGHRNPRGQRSGLVHLRRHQRGHADTLRRRRARRPVAHHRLGLINPALYTLGALSRAGVPNTGIVDVTSGNNTFGGVTGYDATPGYDLASGWGTVDAAKFVPALARIGGL